MRVCDYIPLMSPVSWVKKWISNARFAGKRHFFDGIYPAPPDNFDPVCFHKRYAAAYRS